MGYIEPIPLDEEDSGIGLGGESGCVLIHTSFHPFHACLSHVCSHRTHTLSCSIIFLCMSCLLTALSHHHTYSRSNRNEFVNGLSGNNVPPEYIPAIEKGFAEACQQGASVGAPLQGVRFVVTDGAAHSVDRCSCAALCCPLLCLAVLCCDLLRFAALC
jgi:translation elongation factor EF-G